MNLICVIDKKTNGIGYKNDLLVRLKNDMIYFKNVTTKTSDDTKKNIVVMGKNTWYSIPKKYRPLTNRINIILSKKSKKKIETEIKKNNYVNTYVYSSPEIFLNNLKKIIYEKIFIIGGESIYNYFIINNLISTLYITEIISNLNLKCDTYLLKIDFSDYNIVSKSSVIIENNCYSPSLESNINEVQYIFICYEKIKQL